MEVLPDFEKGNGLVPVIVQDSKTKDVLMLAYMNREAWDVTIATKKAHYFSRSRGRLWQKGEESGNVQIVKEIRLDCDRDTVLLFVEQKGGAACHKGYRSCFFRRVGINGHILEEEVCEPKIFEPEEVYGQDERR